MSLADFFKRNVTKIKQNIDNRTKDALLDAFAEFKEELLEDIRNHPVSQELVGHTQPSQFLSGSRGTLFGFIGFNQGREPVKELIEFLRLFIQPRFIKRDSGLFSLMSTNILQTRVPSREDLRKAGNLMPDVWGYGETWPEMIEGGIEGLPKFLANRTDPNSRSKEGLQAIKPIRGNNYQRVGYLSEIFLDFRNKILRTKGIEQL